MGGVAPIGWRSAGLLPWPSDERTRRPASHLSHFRRPRILRCGTLYINHVSPPLNTYLKGFKKIGLVSHVFKRYLHYDAYASCYALNMETCFLMVTRGTRVKHLWLV